MDPACRWLLLGLLLLRQGSPDPPYLPAPDHHSTVASYFMRLRPVLGWLFRQISGHNTERVLPSSKRLQVRLCITCSVDTCVSAPCSSGMRHDARTVQAHQRICRLGAETCPHTDNMSIDIKHYPTSPLVVQQTPLRVGPRAGCLVRLITEWWQVSCTP